MRALLLALLLPCAAWGACNGGIGQAIGNTITFTANVSGSVPTPVQAIGSGSNAAICYLLTNAGTNLAFVACAATAAQATTNAVVPTSTSQPVYPLMAGTQVVIAATPNSYCTAITSSGTSVIYVTPWDGQ